MKASQLIGKEAIRTKPVQYETGIKDFSYTTSSIKIIKVTDSHIVYQNKMFDTPSILDIRWQDGNWEDYEKLVK